MGCSMDRLFSVSVQTVCSKATHIVRKDVVQQQPIYMSTTHEEISCGRAFHKLIHPLHIYRLSAAPCPSRFHLFQLVIGDP